MKKIKIGQRIIGEHEPVFIIAEAGVNHNGDLELGKKLIDAAKEAGADAVKFQTFKAENLNTRSAPKSTYHLETTGAKQSWYDLLKTQELDRSAHKILIEHCSKAGIVFLSTPYDEESADLLEELSIPAFKVASTDANNIPFLQYLAKKKLPIILSTAMCTLDEVSQSVRAIRKEGCKDIVLLHCTTNYPAKIIDSNLRAMLTMKEKLNVLIGYSDHTLGYINSVAATAMGAVVYEKHFTLDKSMPGPDHRSSLDPTELKQMVSDIRQAEVALGMPEKRPTGSEKENRQKLRKSIVAKRDIQSGEIIKADMLAIKRPGTGLPPTAVMEVIGKRARKVILREQLIDLKELT